MAIYKVPQDVEAEDKLIGPFSFRQFIYLIVAALGIAMAVILFQIFPGLIVIPLPFILIFLVLALPLRKEQPMETYLVAVVRFFLKPRKRMWQPDGSIGMVTITAPKTTDMQLTKGYSGSEAAQRLGYLAQVVDTQGWSTRGVLDPGISMNDTVYAEALMAEDVLDEDNNVARTFDSMIHQSNEQHKQSVIQQIQTAAAAPTDQIEPAESAQIPQEPPATPISQSPVLSDDEIQSAPEPAAPAFGIPLPTVADDTDLGDVTFDYNPYPSNMHQHVVAPHRPQAKAEIKKTAPEAIEPKSLSATPDKATITSETPVSPDILRLASNNDLSISALANEANRLKDEDEEVVISLR